LDHDAVLALTAADLDRLRSIASGADASPYRARALDALVLAAAPDLPALLGEIVGNRDEDTATRAAAATQLARSIGPAAEGLLLRALPAAAHVVVRVKITGALARVGGVASLPWLDRLAGDPEPAVSRMAAFGRSVISYRLGLPGHEVPTPDDFLTVDAERSGPIAVDRAGAEEAGATLASLRNDTFGLALSTRRALRIECGLNRLVLMFSEDFARRGADSPLRQPTVPGLIAQRAPGGSYSVRLVLLAGPQDEGGFHLAAYRTDGTQTMFGLATADTFELRSVPGRGSLPVLLRGRFQGPEVIFTAATSAQRVTNQSTPRELTL
jgi:hypothetical protein